MARLVMLVPEDIKHSHTPYVENVVGVQLQWSLVEADYLNLFQSGFNPAFNMHMTLMVFDSDRWQDQDRDTASFPILLDLLAASNITIHYFF